MYKQVSFFIYILNLNCSIIYAYYNAKCPSGQLWYLRAQSICISVEKYTCLFDSVNNIYSESCSGPRTDPPGDKTVVNSGNFDTKPCSPDRLQPFPFSSSQGNDCIYMKSFCSEEGQIVYTNGTTKNDRECRCDYTKGFHFISTRKKNICSCDPRKEDCSCVIKPCSEGEILSPDYQCIKKDISHGKFVCKEIDFDQTTENTLNEVQDSYTSKPITREKAVPIATKALIILTTILILVFIIWFLMHGKLQKNVKLLNRDRNSIQASDQDFDQNSHFGSIESFKSAQETLDERKTDILQTSTKNVKVGDGNENKKNHLKDKTNKGPEIKTEMTLQDKMTVPDEMTAPDNCISDETEMLSKWCQDQGNSPETKKFSLHTTDEWLHNIKLNNISKASVEHNSLNVNKTVDEDINDKQTKQLGETNVYTMCVADSSNAFYENYLKGKSKKTNKSEELKYLYLKNSTKTEKELSPDTEKKQPKIVEEVNAKRAEVMKELLIGYSESLKVVFGKTVSSFYQYFFRLNEERKY